MPIQPTGCPFGSIFRFQGKKLVLEVLFKGGLVVVVPFLHPGLCPGAVGVIGQLLVHGTIKLFQRIAFSLDKDSGQLAIKHLQSKVVHYFFLTKNQIIYG
jgi:hypothetical protein